VSMLLPLKIWALVLFFRGRGCNISCRRLASATFSSLLTIDVRRTDANGRRDSNWSLGDDVVECSKHLRCSRCQDNGGIGGLLLLPIKLPNYSSMDATKLQHAHTHTHTHTHTHMHTHTQTQTHTHKHTQNKLQPLFLSLSFSHFLSLILSLYLLLALALSLSISLYIHASLSVYLPIYLTRLLMLMLLM
jgi:hypothetical protein